MICTVKSWSTLTSPNWHLIDRQIKEERVTVQLRRLVMDSQPMIKRLATSSTPLRITPKPITMQRLTPIDGTLHQTLCRIENTYSNRLQQIKTQLAKCISVPLIHLWLAKRCLTRCLRPLLVWVHNRTARWGAWSRQPMSSSIRELKYETVSCSEAQDSALPMQHKNHSGKAPMSLTVQHLILIKEAQQSKSWIRRQYNSHWQSHHQVATRPIRITALAVLSSTRFHRVNQCCQIDPRQTIIANKSQLHL